MRVKGRVLPGLICAGLLATACAHPLAAPARAMAQAMPAKAPAAAPPVAPSPPPAPRLVSINGAIPILEYHRIGQDGRWDRSVASFQGDLARLYTEGFVPVDLRALGDPVLPVPPGSHPVVLTFDDGDPSQFAWNAGQTAPAADSAAGVLWAFCQTHPSWRFRATFFVNNHPFGSDSGSKLRWLVAHGAEIGNHTYDRADLAALSPAARLREIGLEQAYIAREIPGYQAVSFAYPYGAFPDWRAIAQGSYAGATWSFRYLALVGSAPQPGVPGSFPANLQRIQVTDPRFVQHPQWRDLVWPYWEQHWLPTAHLYTVRRAAGGTPPGG